MKTDEQDNINQVVKDIRYLIGTDCNDETIQARINNYIQDLSKPEVTEKEIKAEAIKSTKENVSWGYQSSDFERMFIIGAKWMQGVRSEQPKVDALIEKYEKHVKSLEIGLLQSTSKQQVYERNEEISLFKHFIEDLESLKDTNH